MRLFILHSLYSWTLFHLHFCLFCPSLILFIFTICCIKTLICEGLSLIPVYRGKNNQSGNSAKVQPNSITPSLLCRANWELRHFPHISGRCAMVWTRNKMNRGNPWKTKLSDTLIYFTYLIILPFVSSNRRSLSFALHSGTVEDGWRCLLNFPFSFELKMSLKYKNRTYLTSPSNIRAWQVKEQDSTPPPPPAPVPTALHPKSAGQPLRLGHLQCCSMEAKWFLKPEWMWFIFL